MKQKLRSPLPALEVTSPAFVQGAPMPALYTGYGADISPPLHLMNLTESAVSLAIVLEDLDIPFVPRYTHWLIWNLPPLREVPAHIPPGAVLAQMDGAVQGLGYGKHCYRGPKPPAFVRRAHRYVFSVYALDCRLTIGADSRKAALLRAMEGHVLQRGALMGRYRR